MSWKNTMVDHTQETRDLGVVIRRALRAGGICSGNIRTDVNQNSVRISAFYASQDDVVFALLDNDVDVSRLTFKIFESRGDGHYKTTPKTSIYIAK